MDQILLMWIVGILVLLATMLCTLIYWREKYLIVKEQYSDCQEVSDCFKGYLLTKLHVEKVIKNRIRWFIFGSKYLDLINYQSDRLLSSFERLKHFESSKEDIPLFRSYSFMDQWDAIREMVFITRDIEGEKHYSIDERFGNDPFGCMGTVFSAKIYDLYKKFALQTLRTHGFIEFNRVLNDYSEISSRYSFGSPLLYIKTNMRSKIVSEAKYEIADKAWSEFLKITNNGLPKNEEDKKIAELINSSTYKSVFNNFGSNSDKKLFSVKNGIESFRRKKIVLKKSVT